MMRIAFLSVVCIVAGCVFSSPVMGSADIDVLSWMWYKGEHDTYHVVGEVQNIGDSSAEFVKLIAVLYDDVGEIVDTDFTYTYLDIIAPNERSPFKISFWDLPAEPKRCRLQSEWRTTEYQPTRHVSVSSIRGYYDSDYNVFKIVGEVANSSGFPVEFVKVIFTCYDEEEDVITCDYTYTTLDTIRTGGSSPFDAWISDWASRVKTFRYMVQYRKK